MTTSEHLLLESKYLDDGSLAFPFAEKLYADGLVSAEEAAAMTGYSFSDFINRIDRVDEPAAVYYKRETTKSNSIVDELEMKKKQIQELCEQANVQRLYVFGSAIRNDFNFKKSDLDFLVEFRESISMKNYTDGFFELLFGFQNLFHRKIDLLTQKSIKNPILLREIERTKKLLYEA